MASMPKIEITKMYLVFFPFATFKRVGNMRLLKVLGVSVYAAQGDINWCLGYVWRSRKDAS